MIASWPKIVSSWDPEESPALCAYLDQFIDLMNKWSVSYTAIVLKYRRMLGSQEPKTFYAKRPKFVV